MRLKQKAGRNSYSFKGFKQNVFACFFYLLTIVNVKANIDFDDNCKNIYIQIQNLEIEAANKHIALAELSSPNNNALAYLKHFLYFVSIFNSENSAHYALYEKENKVLFNKIIADPSETPYKLYLLSEMYLHRAILAFKEKEFITAAKYLNSSYQLIKQNQTIYRDFAPNSKISGIMELALSYIPPQFEWIGKMLGYQGNKEKGLDELKAFFNSCEVNKYKYLEAESYFIQLVLNIYYFDDVIQTNKIIEEIKQSNNSSLKNNPFINYAQVLAYIYMGKSNEALHLTDKNKRLNITTYYKGLLLLYKLDSDASKYFKNYAFSGNQHLKGAAFQKLAWHHLIQNDTIGYKTNLQNILKYSNNLLEPDKNAIKEAKSGIIPNIVLLKARLLFDGGYYLKSLEQMRKINPSIDMQQTLDYLEYIYRFARIYHKLSDFGTAEKYYLQVLEIGENEKAYFYINSLLQLGIIAEKQGNQAKAANYYKQCLIFGQTNQYHSIKEQASIKLYRIEQQ